MAYYLTGDYYRGDYYTGRMGDPGIFSAIGSVLKAGVAGLGGFLTGGPIGAATGVIGSFASKPPPTPPGQGGLVLPGGTMISPQRILPGGAPFISHTGMAAQRGYHLDKRTHSRWVRNRSMNPANPRALRRAVRREHSFVALAKRVLRGTGITIGRRSFASKRRFGAKR